MPGDIVSFSCDIKNPVGTAEFEARPIISSGCVRARLAATHKQRSRAALSTAALTVKCIDPVNTLAHRAHRFRASPSMQHLQLVLLKLSLNIVTILRSTARPFMDRSHVLPINLPKMHPDTSWKAPPIDLVRTPKDHMRRYVDTLLNIL